MNFLHKKIKSDKDFVDDSYNVTESEKIKFHKDFDATNRMRVRKGLPELTYGQFVRLIRESEYGYKSKYSDFMRTSENPYGK